MVQQKPDYLDCNYSESRCVQPTRHVAAIANSPWEGWVIEPHGIKCYNSLDFIWPDTESIWRLLVTLWQHLQSQIKLPQ